MYYKTEIDGYILIVSRGVGETQISEEEYNNIMFAIQNRPHPPEGYDYRLRAADLEWVLVELPPEPTEDLTPEEALEILLGGGGE